MKFFIPHAKDIEETEKIYKGIKVFLTEELGADFSTRRIQSIVYSHGNKTYTAEVGKRNLVNGEEIIAILYEASRSLYHVCTPNRGVLRGGSILVGVHEVQHVQDFD